MSTRQLRNVAFAAFVCITAIQLGGCGMARCIAEGTLVATPQGERQIESLHLGDQVISLDARGQLAVSTVIGARSAYVSSALEITLPTGQSLVATATHPIMTKAGWINAGSLSHDEMVSTQSGEMRVTLIRPINRPLRVHDLTVSPHENFFANGMLVHNKTVAMRPQESSLIGPWLYQSSDGRRYRFDLEPDGHGLAQVITEGYDLESRSGTYGASSIEFISWSLSNYEIQIRIRYSGQPTTLLVGHATEHKAREYGYFELDGRLAERPERLLMQLEALGLQPANDPQSPSD